MDNQNISDLIEEYIKEILVEKDKIEIKRAEIASQFSCVPSQINYVIKTRFTVAQGYNVESKRGGGGYIRIKKITLNHHGDILTELENVVGNKLTQHDATAILQQLYNYDIINKREGALLHSLMSSEILQADFREKEDMIRANMIKIIIERLRYEEKE
ncbi:CtsR family transcriptional regulator [Vagococcus intermedius]|uniref:Transcriptional regulator CtsR n=1 Tax=Vagococcus intermedius TaxID=2991418 RepID=A0AAF0CV62_9ENTE|nr:CtsR family transcriptional regulator [Vagococcus intermedius]WEG73312.1 CtsR family transcriptional regulator [Vagococcus intermedius]WEG75392.1 CtsR family transcriptional regulator [Vagococcus intermedius]